MDLYCSPQIFSVIDKAVVCVGGRVTFIKQWDAVGRVQITTLSSI